MAAFERTAPARGALRDSTRPVPAPEDAFLAWALWLPAGTDIAEQARVEIARIDGADLGDERSARLRALFVEAAGRLVRTC